MCESHVLGSWDELEIDCVYRLHHSRKGDCGFCVTDWYTIDDDTDAFVNGQVVNGHLIGMGAGSLREPGDRATVRWSLCTFTKRKE